MECQEYIDRCKAVSSYQDRFELLAAVREKDNVFRELFSRQRESWDVPELDDPFRSLIPVHDQEDAFNFVEEFAEEGQIPKVCALGESRKAAGVKAIVGRSEFERNFNECFCEAQLRHLDWSNVFAAGGSVMACLQPLEAKADINNRTRRQYMHDVAFPGSDIDLFLYGLNAEQARAKIQHIYEAVLDANPHDVRCFRSAHSISLVSQYPFRHIQIVLRLYSSPYEVLAGFDVDSCAVGYDGKRVWMVPRCHMALVTQCNHIDMTRRSPTYEMRLAKYAKRGFEVAVPGLNRSRIDPMLFEKPWNLVKGLSRLLLLERLRTPEARFRYKEEHRMKQMRRAYSSSFATKFRLRSLVANQWCGERLESVRGGADASDYSTVFLPWGPGYDSAKCARMMWTKDRLLNNKFLCKGRKYPLHPCFIGTAEQVMKDPYPEEDPLPDDAPPEHREAFVRGPLTFIEDNPGRQMIGSFHPVEQDDWEEGAYFLPSTAAICIAANANDVAGIAAALEGGAQVDCRDFLGRTPLHLAVLSNHVDALKFLLEKKANIANRLPDGRTVLHIAASYGASDCLAVLLAHRAQALADFQAAVKEGEAATAAAQAAAGGDSEPAEAAEAAPATYEDADRKYAAAKKELEDAEKQLSLSAEDWNTRLQPLHCAIMLGHAGCAEQLLAAGANPNVGIVIGEIDETNPQVLMPLQLAITLSTWDVEASKKIVDSLVAHSCNATWISPKSMATYLHFTAKAGAHHFIRHLLAAAPAVKQLLHVIDTNKWTALHQAIAANKPECVEALIEAGSKVTIDEELCDSARQLTQGVVRTLRCPDWSVRQLEKLKLTDVTQPLVWAVQALRRFSDDDDSLFQTAIRLLSGAEEDAATGGRDSPDKDQQDPFRIIKTLLKAGADPSELVSAKVTILDWLAAQKKPIVEKLALHDGRLVRRGLMDPSKAVKDNSRKSPGARTGALDLDSLDSVDEPETGLENLTKDVLASLKKDSPGSYLVQLTEAKALQERYSTVASAVKDTNRVDETVATLKLCDAMISLLKEHGGKTYAELHPEEPVKKEREEERDESANRQEEVQKRLKELKSGFAMMRKGGYRHDSSPVPSTLMPRYAELFEACWVGDIATVERLTLQAPEGEICYVSSTDASHMTPLILAVQRGHADLAKRLLEIASAQYTPKPEDLLPLNPDAVPVPPATMLNNMVLESLVEERDGSEYSDNESIDDAMQADADGYQARQNAIGDQMATISLADATKQVCHTGPSVLFSATVSVPVKWLMDGDLFQRSENRDPDQVLSTLAALYTDRSKDATQEVFNRHERTTYLPNSNWQTSTELSALNLAIIRGDEKMVATLLLTMQRIAVAHHEPRVEGNSTTAPVPPKEISGAAFLNEHVRTMNYYYNTSSFNPVVLAIAADSPPILSHLLKACGGAFKFTNLARMSGVYVPQGSAATVPAVNPDGDSELVKAWQESARTLRCETPLMLAAYYAAPRVMEYLAGPDSQADLLHFLKNDTTEEALVARLLGGKLAAVRKGEAITAVQNAKLTASQPELASPEDACKALAPQLLFDIIMQDGDRRNAFHYLVEGRHAAAVGDLLSVCQARGQGEAALKALSSSPPLNWATAVTLEGYRADREPTTCTSNALSPLQQALVQAEDAELVKALLDAGADPCAPDAHPGRGWNALCFVMVSQKWGGKKPESRERAEAVLQCLLSHPKVPSEKLLTERVGPAGLSPIMIAAGTAAGEHVMEALLRWLQSTEELSAPSAVGSSVLHIATRSKTPVPVASAILKKIQGAPAEAMAVAEDPRGLTPMDVSLNSLVQKQLEPERQRYYYYSSRPKNTILGSLMDHITTYLAIRKVAAQHPRKLASFEDVQKAVLAATDAAQKPPQLVYASSKETTKYPPETKAVLESDILSEGANDAVQVDSFSCKPITFNRSRPTW